MITSKDFEAFDLLLMGFQRMRKDSFRTQDLLNLFFSFLARHTNLYTADSTEVAQQLILANFEKYQAEAMRAKEPDDDDDDDDDDDESIPSSSTDEYFQEDDESDSQLQSDSSNSENKYDISNYPGSPSPPSKIEICWSPKLSEFPGRSQHAAVAVGNTIYSFGGFNYPTLIHDDPLDVFALDVNDTEMEWGWMRIKNNIGNQQLGQSAVAYKNFVFIFGGVDTERNKVSNLTHRLDLQTLTMTKLNVTGNIPNARYLHSAVVIGDELIIFGGHNPNFSLTNDLHSLNLESFCWSKVTTKGTPPSPRSNHSATVCNDNLVLIFGGYDREGGKCSNQLFCFDVNLQQWTKPKSHGTTPKRRQGHSAFVRDGLIFIFGGYYFNKKNDELVHLNDLFCFDPETFEWKELKPIGEPPSPRRNFGCVALGDRVFIFGGENKNYLDDMFVLEMPCETLTRAVSRRVSINAKADKLLRGQDQDQDQDQGMIKRSARHKNDEDSKKRKEKDRENHGDSSSEDESNKEIIVARTSVKLNPSIHKVKIESDYIPPTLKVKVEPDE